MCCKASLHRYKQRLEIYRLSILVAGRSFNPPGVPCATHIKGNLCPVGIMLARDYSLVGSEDSAVAEWVAADNIGVLKSIGSDLDGGIIVSDTTGHNAQVKNIMLKSCEYSTPDVHSRSLLMAAVVTALPDAIEFAITFYFSNRCLDTSNRWSTRRFCPFKYLLASSAGTVTGKMFRHTQQYSSLNVSFTCVLFEPTVTCEDDLRSPVSSVSMLQTDGRVEASRRFTVITFWTEQASTQLLGLIPFPQRSCLAAALIAYTTHTLPEKERYERPKLWHLQFNEVAIRSNMSPLGAVSWMHEYGIGNVLGPTRTDRLTTFIFDNAK